VADDRYFTPRGRLLRFITTAHRAMYRASRGRLGGSARGKPTLLLTTTGRKTGQSHTVPLPFMPDGDRMVVIASFAGSPKHPAWYLNLAAHADVTIQVRDRTLTAKAVTAEGEERAALWARITADMPWYEDYQRQTSRVIPLVVLNPV
jgi:F420H(2)-dependent quinone reductase